MMEFIPQNSNENELKDFKDRHFDKKLDGSNSCFSVGIIGNSTASILLRNTLSSAGYNIVRPGHGTASFFIPSTGAHLEICDETEQWHDSGHVAALIALIYFSCGGRELAVPSSAPGALEHIASDYDGTVLRVGRDDGAEQLLSTQGILCDPFSAALYLCRFLSTEKTTMRRAIRAVPDFTLISREIPVSRNRHEILQDLADCADGLHKELCDNLRVCTDGGWVNISPSQSKSALRITGEGMSEEIANDLCSLFIERTHAIDINGLQK